MQIVDPIERPDWSELLLASPGHSFFHTSCWAQVLRDAYGYRPRYLARIADGGFRVLLPFMEVDSFLTGRRGVSLPFTDYCEPIMQNPAEWPEVLGQAKSLSEREQWTHWEIRGGERLMDDAPCSSVYFRHILKLSPDADAVYRRLRDSTKRNIRKARKEGVVVTHGVDCAAMEGFYRLHCMTRKKHGLPPQPFSFFKRIHEHVVSRGHGQVALADWRGKTIAAAVYLHFGSEAIYKYGASDGDCLQVRPNDLLMWETISRYCECGCERFCFGRTEPENRGLRQFKNGWGGEERTLRYFTWDVRTRAFRREKQFGGAVTAAVFRRLPIPLAKLAGTILYRHVG